MTADIAVLRQKVHGMSASAYADAIRDRLPDYVVTQATTPAAERDLLRDAPVATGYDLDPDVLPDSDLQLFACVYAGTGHLPLDELDAHDVAVTSAAGVHAPNVSEWVLGAILSFAQGFPEARRRQRRSEWRSFQTHELMGSTVTVVGQGSIGTAVVDRLDPFHAHTVGVRHSPSKGGPTDEVVGLDDEAGIHDALARTDYLAVAAPLTDETRGFVDADALRTLPPDAVVVNVGRGPIVDTDALVGALRSNAIRGAALDVTDPEPLPGDHPLWTFENVLLTPHNAGHTPSYWTRLSALLARNVRQAETGGYEDLENQVV